MITNFCLFSLTKQKHFSQNFQIAKRKKGWGVQVEDPHVDLFTIQKNTLFLFYRQILIFYLKKIFHFLKKAATFCKEMGGVPLRVNMSPPFLLAKVRKGCSLKFPDAGFLVFFFQNRKIDQNLFPKSLHY